MLSSREQWTENLDALATVSRPVTIELCAHGLSPSPGAPQAYRMSAICDQLETLRQELDAPQVVLCGQSFGACITLRYGLLHPARVKAHIVTNSMSALGEPRRGGAEMARYVERGGRDAIDDMPMHPRHARHLPPVARERLLLAASAVDPRGLSSLLRVTVDEASVASELEMITCPVLLVNGTREAAFQPWRRSLSSRMPNLRVVDLDAGHAVNLQCADDFNRSAVDFIRSV